ncbi:MAG: hypothetical protein OXB93_04200 [Cytophagales bacterium]|nr:hypothetical protein [Cytophagales bacterium]
MDEKEDLGAEQEDKDKGRSDEDEDFGLPSFDDEDSGIEDYQSSDEEGYGGDEYGESSGGSSEDYVSSVLGGDAYGGEGDDGDYDYSDEGEDGDSGARAKKFITTVVVLLLVCGAGGFGFFLWIKKNKKDAPDTALASAVQTDTVQTKTSPPPEKVQASTQETNPLNQANLGKTTGQGTLAKTNKSIPSKAKSFANKSKRGPKYAKTSRKSGRRKNLSRSRNAGLSASGSDNYEVVSSRTGRYYVVVASFLDDGFAVRHAKGLSKKGYQVRLLSPLGRGKFHRVAVAESPSWKEVVLEIDRWKAEFGGDVWALRF